MTSAPCTSIACTRAAGPNRPMSTRPVPIASTRPTKFVLTKVSTGMSSSAESRSAIGPRLSTMTSASRLGTMPSTSLSGISPWALPVNRVAASRAAAAVVRKRFMGVLLGEGRPERRAAGPLSARLGEASTRAGRVAERRRGGRLAARRGARRPRSDGRVRVQHCDARCV